jgi:hypothetical protein
MESSANNRAEPLDSGGADGDEGAAHDQRGGDAEQQHPVLVGGRHRERGHDDDEDEQVVHRQALFDQPAGEALRARTAAPHRPDQPAEGQRDPDVQRRPGRGLAQPYLVGMAADGHEIQGDQGQDPANRGDPAPERNIQHQASERRDRKQQPQPRVGSFPSRKLWSCGWARRGGCRAHGGMERAVGGGSWRRWLPTSSKEQQDLAWYAALGAPGSLVGTHGPCDRELATMAMISRTIVSCAASALSPRLPAP